MPLSTLQDRPLNKSRGTEVALSSWAYLFGEVVQYTQARVAGIADFEKKLSAIGYRVGLRLVELLPLRDSLPVSLHSTLWPIGCIQNGPHTAINLPKSSWATTPDPFVASATVHPHSNLPLSFQQTCRRTGKINRERRRVYDLRQ